MGAMSNAEAILAEAAGEVRAIESNADQALSIIRYLEDCTDPDELRVSAATLRAAADYLGRIADSLEEIAERATLAQDEEEEEEDEDEAAD